MSPSSQFTPSFVSLLAMSYGIELIESPCQGNGWTVALRMPRLGDRSPRSFTVGRWAGVPGRAQIMIEGTVFVQEVGGTYKRWCSNVHQLDAVFCMLSRQSRSPEAAE
jgi:hypothetical protein